MRNSGIFDIEIMTGRNKRKLSGGFSQKSRSKVIQSNSMNAVGGQLCLSQDDNNKASQAYTSAAGLDRPIDLDSVESQGSTSQCTSHTTAGTNKGYTIKCKHCAEEINMNAEDSEISHLQCCIICDCFYHGECLSIPQSLLSQLYIVIRGWWLVLLAVSAESAFQETSGTLCSFEQAGNLIV